MPGTVTESLGKVFHIGHGNLGDPKSFSIPHFHDKVIEIWIPRARREPAHARRSPVYQPKAGAIDRYRGGGTRAPEAKDDDYADGRVAAETIRRLEAARQRVRWDAVLYHGRFRAAASAVFCAEKYWDLFDPAKLPMPTIKTFPKDAAVA